MNDDKLLPAMISLHVNPSLVALFYPVEGKMNLHDRKLEVYAVTVCKKMGYDLHMSMEASCYTSLAFLKRCCDGFGEAVPSCT